MDDPQNYSDLVAREHLFQNSDYGNLNSVPRSRKDNASLHPRLLLSHYIFKLGNHNRIFRKKDIIIATYELNYDFDVGLKGPRRLVLSLSQGSPDVVRTAPPARSGTTRKQIVISHNAPAPISLIWPLHSVQVTSPGRGQPCLGQAKSKCANRHHFYGHLFFPPTYLYSCSRGS
ncbi:hypothetical protein CEXT_658441 [Caerostris extrusa]|uniref:Uncharacterized protein n=1 Tax=Caerostris extrusa TaxID=172846 RepID=A0AAV4N048_CAEEX|nr:hypothetical protein CEXT_658441 [Caerostris extrusa]